MTSPVVPLMFAGAAVYLLSQGKRRSGGTSKEPGPYIVPAESLPEEFLKSGSSSNWKQRQEALVALAGVEFNLRDGRSVKICARCHPGRTDGEMDDATRSAIKSFQAFSGLDVTGEWGVVEDRSMARVLRAIDSDEPIICDPISDYPAPLYCAEISGMDGNFLHEKKEGGPTVEDMLEPEQWTPHDVLVSDPECNYIIHESAEFVNAQKIMSLEYALDGMDDIESAEEIHERLMAEYLPLCLTLGKDGVGEGMQIWWSHNVILILSDLKTYATLPELLEEDAIKYGLL